MRLSLVAVLLSTGAALADKPSGPPVDPRPRGVIPPTAWQDHYQTAEVRVRPLADFRDTLSPFLGPVVALFARW